MSQMHNAIEFKDVTFRYRGSKVERPALDGVTFSLARGEFACVVGGNGSGKSTLARHIDALLLPDQGQVKVLDIDTSTDIVDTAIRKRCGMVFQNPDDQIVASIVEDEVAFGPANLGIATAELKERVEEALAAVGLADDRTRSTALLSGGQKQRLAIAGVLAMQPDIIVLDEATSMLDPKGRADILAICEKLHERGLTVVMITHSMEEAAKAERIYVMESGRLACQGSPDEVLSDTELLHRLHLAPTFATRLSQRLKAGGITLPTCIRDDDLVHTLAGKKHA